MQSVLLVAVVLCCTSFSAASNVAAVSGSIYYVAFDSDTTLKSIDLANKNKVAEVLKFPPYQYPTWSESSATNGHDMMYYNFIANDDVTGITVGVNITEKKIVFSWKTNYFWRLAFNPSDPEYVYGLTIGNNIILQRVNISDGKVDTLGHLPDGLTQPDNSAVFDMDADIFYAFVANENSDTSIFGIDVVAGKVVSNATVDPDTLYLCESVKDESTGTFYGVVMDGDSNAWLAKIDVKTGKVTKVGTDKMAVSSCDADSALSEKQRLYFAYIKDNDGNSQITVWNLDTGALVEHFVVENAVFGMQMYE